MDCGARGPGFGILALPLASCVTSDTFLKLSRPPLQGGNEKHPLCKAGVCFQ